MTVRPDLLEATQHAVRRLLVGHGTAVGEDTVEENLADALPELVAHLEVAVAIAFWERYSWAKAKRIIATGGTEAEGVDRDLLDQFIDELRDLADRIEGQLDMVEISDEPPAVCSLD